eukprot:GILK01003707.1.p1 GENE.GILK01003707.1~~GILK01003707.1.p1  ORF type:complete len:287 (-),score=47.28 GILK01003707.1:183-1013(-)
MASATEPRVPTLEELRDKWSQFAEAYHKHIQPSTAIAARQLASMLRLKDATSVLEVGAGPGVDANDMLPLLPSGARFVVTDLSPEMVKICKQSLPSTVIVEEANAQALQYETASFDRYFASLSLQLVPDPDQMLREARRVLQPGGLAGFAVWGRKENSSLFTIQPSVMNQLGIVSTVPPVRSNFHLSNKQELRQRVLNAGFSKVLLWYTAIVHDFKDGQEYADIFLTMHPDNRRFLESLSEEDRQKLFKGIAAEADAILDRGDPITLEALLVVAQA